MSDVNVIVRGIPPELKAALVAEARRGLTSVNVVAVGILAEHFGVDYAGNGRMTTATAESTQQEFTMPEALGYALGFLSVKERRPKSQIILAILCDHYGIAYTPPTRGRQPAAA